MNRKFLTVAALAIAAIAALHFGVADAGTMGILAIGLGGVLTETTHTGEFILSEANLNLSRDNITVASGQVLDAGQVIGKITATGKYAVYDNNAGDGTQTAAGILLAYTDASAGDALAVIINKDAEVIADSLVWESGNGAEAAGLVDLLALGIKAR